jgi:hypothetical protein
LDIFFDRNHIVVVLSRKLLARLLPDEQALRHILEHIHCVKNSYKFWTLDPYLHSRNLPRVKVPAKSIEKTIKNKPTPVQPKANANQKMHPVF